MSNNDRVFKQNPPAGDLQVLLAQSFGQKGEEALRLLNLLDRIRQKGQERGFGVLDEGSSADTTFGVEWVGRAKFILCVDYQKTTVSPKDPLLTSYQLKRELALRDYDHFPFTEYTETVAFFRELGARWIAPRFVHGTLVFSAVLVGTKGWDLYTVCVKPPKDCPTFSQRTGMTNFGTITHVLLD